MLDALYVASVAVAHAATNFDNLAVLFALAPALGAARCVSAYVLSQAIAMGLAVAAGLGALSVLAGWTGWLGLVPIALGLLTLRRRAGSDAHRIPPGSFALTALMFLGLATDSFAIMAAIIADGGRAYLFRALQGVVLSVLVLSVATLVFVRFAGRAEAISLRLERLSPFAMIAAGIYILLNTPTDTI